MAAKEPTPQGDPFLKTSSLKDALDLVRNLIHQILGKVHTSTEAKLVSQYLTQFQKMAENLSVGLQLSESTALYALDLDTHTLNFAPKPPDLEEMALDAEAFPGDNPPKMETNQSKNGVVCIPLPESRAEKPHQTPTPPLKTDHRQGPPAKIPDPKKGAPFVLQMTAKSKGISRILGICDQLEYIYNRGTGHLYGDLTVLLFDGSVFQGRLWLTQIVKTLGSTAAALEQAYQTNADFLKKEFITRFRGQIADVVFDTQQFNGQPSIIIKGLNFLSWGEFHCVLS